MSKNKYNYNYAYIYGYNLDGFGSDALNQNNVNQNVLLWLKNAGIDLVSQYGINTASDPADVANKISALKDDRRYSVLVNASSELITTYGIGVNDASDPPNIKLERINALVNAVIKQNKNDSTIASPTFNKTAIANASKTNLNTAGENAYERQVAKENVYNTTATSSRPLTKPLVSTNPPPTQYELNGIYNTAQEVLQQHVGRADLGDDPQKLEAINTFLSTFPYREMKQKIMANKKAANGTWVNMTVKDLFLHTIQTAIDIINDISNLISQRNLMSAAEYRRNIYDAFAKPERRTYVGMWLIFLSFILYFIDSST